MPSSKSYPVDELTEMPWVAAVTNIDRTKLWQWVNRGHFHKIRPDLKTFHWPTIRPIIAARMNLPEDAWADRNPTEPA